MLLGTAWMSRVSVDTGYLLGIAVPMVGFGVLVTVFSAAGSGARGRELLAARVSAASTAACVLLAVALIVTAVGRPRRRLILNPPPKGHIHADHA